MGRKKKEIQAVKEVIPMEIIPNCARCRWFATKKHFLYFWNKTEYSACMAQGLRHPPVAYNTECCKKLYEIK